jgi:hypothetical protein
LVSDPSFDSPASWVRSDWLRNGLSGLLCLDWRHRAVNIIVIVVIIAMGTNIDVGGSASTTPSLAWSSVLPTTASGSPTIGKEATAPDPGSGRRRPFRRLTAKNWVIIEPFDMKWCYYYPS